jgi:methylglyoxal synthase
MTDFVAQALESSDPYRGGQEGIRVREAMQQAVARLDAGALADQQIGRASCRERVS